jgi:hypothetical protein
MAPRTRDLVGSALLVVVLFVLVAALVAASIPG